ncbi:hypothetical protein Pmani_020617 [Petrolisthes manimaculis]|uniref:Uncharacterized protein n=1 Tax=Petrolisthes manimaculis TaxID=1843537 RepID=A0AAE1U6D5_9EUCA|nr:hypothetical protein Pmani_020617 [Petrolisthes manimaculis]
MGGAGERRRGGEQRGTGAGPGLGGMEARNLEESQAVEARGTRDTNNNTTVEERVWQHLASLHTPHAPHPTVLPHTLSSWSLPNNNGRGGGVGREGDGEGVRRYQTTGGDYGRFPRGSEVLARPPVSHTLPTGFTHHLAASGMFRNHSLNT